MCVNTKMAEEVMSMVNQNFAFGKYRTRKQELEKKYQTSGTRFTDAYLERIEKSSAINHNKDLTFYFDKKMVRVASAEEYYTLDLRNKKICREARIIDYTTNLTYSTGLQVANDARNARFTIIIGNGYRIHDNPNGTEEQIGVVDANDTFYNKKTHETMTVGEFLNSQF